MPPEVRGAVALALKHAKSAQWMYWFARHDKNNRTAERSRRHLNKAQKLLRRAERLSGGVMFVLCP